MNNAGCLYIVSFEDDTEPNIFTRRISSIKDYENALIDFEIKTNNNYIMRNVEYISSEISQITKLGYVVIKTSNDLSTLSMWLPSIVTDSQYNYLYSNSMEFYKYKNIEGHYIKVENGKVNEYNTDDINKLMLIATKKNSLNNEKGMKK